MELKSVITEKIRKIVLWIAALPYAGMVFVKERKIPKLVRKIADQPVEIIFAKKAKLLKVVLGIAVIVGTVRVPPRKQIHALRIVSLLAGMEYVKLEKIISVAPTTVKALKKVLCLDFIRSKRIINP